MKWHYAGLLLLAGCAGSRLPADDPVAEVKGYNQVRPAESSLFESPVRLAAADGFIDNGPSWGHCGPWVEDVDGDGQRDLVVGDFSGLFHFYCNQGTNREPRYAAAVNLQAGGVDAKVPIY